MLIQPMAADDVASAVARIAVGKPVNGTVEVTGPRLDDLIRRPQKPFTSIRFSAFIQPCRFEEDQGLGNVDFVVGSVGLASVLLRTDTQNSFVFSDVLSFLKGFHAVKVGGSLTRLEE
jgi:hypothetical protein